MKKLFWSAIIILLSGALIYRFQNPLKEHFQTQENVKKSREKKLKGQWLKYTKNGKTIEKKEASEDDLKNLNLPKASTPERKPAKASPPAKGPKIEDRLLIGSGAKTYSMGDRLDFINLPNPDWKDLLSEKALRFQKEDTKLFVKRENSFIKIKGKTARYIEKVVLTYDLGEGNQNSFRAFVDSESGEILSTWDRTIHEQVKKKPLLLSPSNL